MGVTSNANTKLSFESPTPKNFNLSKQRYAVHGGEKKRDRDSDRDKERVKIITETGEAKYSSCYSAMVSSFYLLFLVRLTRELFGFDDL